MKTLKKDVNTFKAIVEHLPNQQLPLGVGFLPWYLEAGHIDLLVAALDLKVQAVLFASTEHVARWINFVRGYDQARGRKTVIFVVVNEAQQATAVAELEVDVLVAEGLVSSYSVALCADSPFFPRTQS